MSIFAFAGAYLKTLAYPYLSASAQKKTQDKYMKSLLRYAKEHSDYYGKLIPDDLDYSKIPPINKTEFIKNFDSIVTDKRCKIKDALEKIKNIDDSEGAKLINKYSITKTSGSTGNPTIILQDQLYQNTESVVGFCRIMKCKTPILMVGESGGFGTEATSIRENMKKAKFVKKIVNLVDVEALNTDEMIEMLTKYGPSTIVGYTGVMTILSNKLCQRGVRLKEKQIFLSGEQCTQFEKDIISRAFDCPKIRILYGCTEAGDIAWECECGHLHVLSDCVHIEPVDENNNPVGYDVESEKLLLTNLMNHVQPIIRYEVTDRIILHKGGDCPCGCKDDWIEILGRTNDNLTFENNGEEIVVPSISLLIAISSINKDGLRNFKNYQIAVSRSGKLHVTLDYFEDTDHDKVNELLTDCMSKFFAKYGLNDITYEFEQGDMKKTSRGKRKRIYMLD